MRWIALQPGFLPLREVDQIDMDGWFVDDLEKPDRDIHVLRVLLRETDPDGLAEFDRVHNEGWRQDPPHWAGERLRRFSAATGRLPDPRRPSHGFWELTDDTVVDLVPKLEWSSRFVGGPVGI